VRSTVLARRIHWAEQLLEAEVHRNTKEDPSCTSHKDRLRSPGLAEERILDGNLLPQEEVRKRYRCSAEGFCGSLDSHRLCNLLIFC